jgi:hypothetical protein
MVLIKNGFLTHSLVQSEDIVLITHAFFSKALLFWSAFLLKTAAAFLLLALNQAPARPIVDLNEAVFALAHIVYARRVLLEALALIIRGAGLSKWNNF